MRDPAIGFAATLGIRGGRARLVTSTRQTLVLQTGKGEEL